MRYARSWICLLLALFLCLGALSGCGEKEEGSGSFVLRTTVCAGLTSLDPATSTQEGAESVFHALFENLLRVADDGEGGGTLVPGMAKEYSVAAEYDGSVTYRFTLRSSVRWSDGQRVRARDFAFAWRRLVDPDTASPHHALLSMVKGYAEVRETGDISKLAVEAENDRTFTVTLSAPCDYFLSEVCTAAETMPLRRDVVLGDPQGWDKSVNFISNGAYRVSGWVPTEYLQLQKSGNYYEDRLVGPDGLRFLFTEDPAAARLLYDEGMADHLALPSAPTAEEPVVSGTLTRVPLRETACVIYNHMSDVFSSKAMRQVFDLAIDRAAVARAAGAEAEPADGFVSPLVPDGTEQAEGEPALDFRSVGGALCAVDEEGYAVRCGAAVEQLRESYPLIGEYPEVECLYAENEADERVAIVLQEMWQTQLGVQVRVTGLAQEEFEARIASGSYELAIRHIGGHHGDAMEFLRPFAGTDAQNELHYVNRTYNLLIGVADSSGDPEARAAFLHDAEKLLLTDAALSPLYFGGRAELLREGLRGVYHDAAGACYFTGVAQTETAAQ